MGVLGRQEGEKLKDISGVCWGHFLLNPFLMNGLYHIYQLDKSTFIFRGTMSESFFFFYFIF